MLVLSVSEWVWASIDIWDRHRYQHYKEEARPSQTGEGDTQTRLSAVKMETWQTQLRKTIYAKSSITNSIGCNYG